MGSFQKRQGGSFRVRQGRGQRVVVGPGASGGDAAAVAARGDALAAAAAAASSASDASTSATAAANAAALVGAPSKAAMDAAMGGDVSGLVPAAVRNIAGRKRSAAVADGATNQATLINADLAALGTAGGGIYELPGGVIAMSATMVVPTNVTVAGASTAGVASTTGTVLKFAAGVKGCTTANFSGLRDVTLTSLDNGVASPAIGVDISGANGAFSNVLVSKFGSHGWHSDTTAGGNENKQRMDNCRAYGNAGDGLHIDGLDSNAWLVTMFDATANKGTGIWNEGCRSTFDQCHIDSAGVGIAAVRDGGIGNTYNVYVETSGATGADFILASASTYGILEAPFYGMPVVKGEGGTTIPFQSWRIYEKSGFRQLLLNDNLLGPNSGAQWIMDSGISGANALRFRRASGGLVFDVDGTSMTRIAFGINLAAGTDGAIDVGTSARRFRNGYFTSWVRVGTTTTGGRPTAATAGAGATMFDTTLGKPIWSTGSAWVDATGATV